MSKCVQVCIFPTKLLFLNFSSTPESQVKTKHVNEEQKFLFERGESNIVSAAIRQLPSEDMLWGGHCLQHQCTNTGMSSTSGWEMSLSQSPRGPTDATVRKPKHSAQQQVGVKAKSQFFTGFQNDSSQKQ